MVCVNGVCRLLEEHGHVLCVLVYDVPFIEHVDECRHDGRSRCLGELAGPELTS